MKSNNDNSTESQEQTQSEDNLKNNRYLSKLKKYVIESNNPELTLVACVLLTFYEKGRNFISKHELIEHTQNFIKNYKNKIYIIKFNRIKFKEIVQSRNLFKRISILLERKTFITKTEKSKGDTYYSLDIKEFEEKFSIIYKELKELPDMKMNEDNDSDVDEEENNNTTKIYSIKDNEEEHIKRKKIDVKNEIRKSILGIGNEKEQNLFLNKKRVSESRNDMDGQTRKKKYLFNTNKSVSQNTKSNSEYKVNNKNKDNINKFNMIKNTNIKNNNNKNINLNTQNCNKNGNENKSVYFLEDNKINNEINYDVLINILNNNCNNLIILLNEIRNNPEAQNKISNDIKSRIQNEINNLKMEINIKNKIMEDKVKQLSILKNDENSFFNHKKELIKLLPNDLKDLCEEYTNNIQILKYFKEIIKLSKDVNKHLFIEKYIESYNHCNLLFERISANLSLVMNEFLYTQNFIDNLYKTINNTSNSLITNIQNYKKNNSLMTYNNFEELRAYLKSKMDDIIKDNFFREYIFFQNYDKTIEETSKEKEKEKEKDNKKQEFKFEHIKENFQIVNAEQKGIENKIIENNTNKNNSNDDDIKNKNNNNDNNKIDNNKSTENKINDVNNSNDESKNNDNYNKIKINDDNNKNKGNKINDEDNKSNDNKINGDKNKISENKKSDDNNRKNENKKNEDNNKNKDANKNNDDNNKNNEKKSNNNNEKNDMIKKNDSNQKIDNKINIDKNKNIDNKSNDENNKKNENKINNGNKNNENMKINDDIKNIENKINDNNKKNNENKIIIENQNEDDSNDKNKDNNKDKHRLYSYNIINNNNNNYDGQKPKIIGDNSNVDEKNSIESNEDPKFDPNNIKIKNTDNFYL